MENIEALVLSELFSELQKYSERFNPFKAMKLQHCETTHSDLFAYLLDPRQMHGCGDGILKAFISEVYKQSKRFGRCISISDFVALSYSEAKILREKGHIDIIIVFNKPNVVFGIEHKIFAPERKDQLRDYQNCLREHYPYHQRILLFLSPDGRESLTANAEDLHCGYFAISYKSILAAIKNCISLAPAHVAHFLELTIDHIREDIMDDSTIKKLVHDLWNSHPDALKQIVDYRPSLADYMTDYFNIFYSQLDSGLDRSDFEEELYPVFRGHAKREVKLYSQNWKKLGLNFCIMFYWEPDDSKENDRPTVRLFLANIDYKQNRGRYDAFFKKHDDIFLQKPVTYSPYWLQVLKPDWQGHDEHPFLQPGARMSEEAAKLALTYYREIDVKIKST